MAASCDTNQQLQSSLKELFVHACVTFRMLLHTRQTNGANQQDKVNAGTKRKQIKMKALAKTVHTINVIDKYPAELGSWLDLLILVSLTDLVLPMALV
eukprot:1161075-Pelagomonas_calceolata.AAC.6